MYTPQDVADAILVNQRRNDIKSYIRSLRAEGKEVNPVLLGSDEAAALTYYLSELYFMTPDDARLIEELARFRRGVAILEEAEVVAVQR